jgi:hypothetical protein
MLLAKTNMEHALISSDVLGDVGVEHRPIARTDKTLSDLRHDPFGFRKQLPGLGGITYDVRALT